MTVYTCGGCGALCEKDDRRCERCNRLAPALFGLRPVLDSIFPKGGQRAQQIGLLLIVIYLGMTVVAQKRGDTGEGLIGKFTAGTYTMIQFGMLVPHLMFDTSDYPSFDREREFAEPISFAHQWWRLITANLIHLGIIHILFNASAMFSLGGFIERLYGPARMLIVFVVAGAIGFLASQFINPSPTAGASAGICGFVGATFAFGKRRGGNHGEAVRQTAVQWAVMVAIFGIIVPGINNVGHAGGAIGGFAVAWFFDVRSLEKQGRESDGARLLALLTLAVVAIAIAFAVRNGLLMMGPPEAS